MRNWKRYYYLLFVVCYLLAVGCVESTTEPENNNFYIDAGENIQFIKLRDYVDSVVPEDIINFILKKYFKKNQELETSSYSISYREINIDNDPEFEHALMIMSRGYCGSLGCSIQLLDKIDGEYNLILKSVGSDLGILQDSTKQHKDLYIDDGRELKKYQWNGFMYSRVEK